MLPHVEAAIGCHMLPQGEDDVIVLANVLVIVLAFAMCFFMRARADKSSTVIPAKWPPRRRQSSLLSSEFVWRTQTNL